MSDELRVETAEEGMESAIAIVGMSGRFPDARNVHEYWTNLRDGRESVSALSDTQLLAAGVPQALLDNPDYVKAGVPLQDMEKFDAGFFGFSPLDASIMDPQHRHFLECCWETLESAGYDPSRFPGAIGVYAGSGHNAYLSRNLMTNPDLVDQVGFFLLRHTGNDKDFLSTRVSYQFDLTGPSVNVQTACSTSLVAIHWACQSLLSGECDMALAGGVTIELPHGRGYLAREGEILSSDGHCRPFEARSNGTLFGSGVGVVLLRRLDDAIEDRDNILAVIRGSAINNDGSGKVGYLAPSVDGQASAIAEAMDIANVSPASIGMLAAHGTGTALGDPIEVAALTQAFGDVEQSGYCALGSVKSNIGHTDTAAGVASLIAAVQALRHRQIPPTLHFENPNPEIDFSDTPFFVNAELRDWESPDGPRRAGVSSLGVGGTNAHVVLEEFAQPPAAAAARTMQLLPLSARTDAALDNATDRLADHLRAHLDISLPDVAHTLQIGRRAFEKRRVAVCASIQESIEILDSRDAGSGNVFSGSPVHDHISVTFMLPGGGAQYPNMGRGLYESEPVYRDCVDELLASLEPATERELRQLLFPDSDDFELAKRELTRPSLQLPLIFITEYALARLWMSWGVQPDALIGHSMGENTAACLAGVFEPRDALALVALRGQLFERVPEGGMLSVPMSPEAVTEMIGPELCLASLNAPELCVVSGPSAALDALASELETRDIATQRVRISVAAHSAMLDPILEEWSAFLEKLELSAPQIPFISNLSGAWITDEEATDPQYWVRHLRNAVRFADGVALLLELPERALLEVGPGGALRSLASMQAGPDRVVLSAMRHPDDESSDLAVALGALGRLWIGGFDVEWSELHDGEARQRIGLPTYPFEHQRYWIEPGTTLYEEGAAAAGPVRHDDLADWFYTPSWKRAPRPTVSECPKAALVFGDDTALCDRLVAKLSERGSDVSIVEVGTHFERSAPGRFVVRPASADDCERVFETLAAEGRTPNAIAHLWNTGDVALGDTVSGTDCAAMLDGYTEARDRGFSSLLAIAQAIGSQDVSDPVKLIVATSGMQQVAGEAPSQPLRALTLGPVRVIGSEYPNVECVSIDVEADDAAAESQADDLLHELAGSSADQIVAYRGGRRFVQSFDHVRLDPPADSTPLRERGVYLITGGLGGLGLALARHLATRCHARLVLLGRHALPPRDTWLQWLASRPSSDWASSRILEIRAIEAAGGEVFPVSADVCDLDGLRAVVDEVQERFGTLNGVIHAAGVLDDAIAQTKGLDEAERVLAPKVRGTLALAEATGSFELDFFALYSSVSAIAGLPGQIDYAAAGSFLDAFAQYRSSCGSGPTVSVGWGPWREIGMAAELSRGGRAAARAMQLSHPLLENHLGDSPKGEQYATDFSTERHWLLDEHRLSSGEALIPGTGFLELAVAGLENRPPAGASGVIELCDVFLAAPFIVPDAGSRQLRLTLERESGDFAFLSGLSVEDHSSGDGVEHVRGTIRYIEEDGGTHSLDEIRDRCRVSLLRFDGVPEPGHLRFGPRWGCIRSVALGHGEALAELEMPEAYSDEVARLRLHPAMLDMATGCAHVLIPGFDPAREFCVPMSYSRVVSFAPMPVHVFAHIRYRDEAEEGDFAVLDVTLIDEDGRAIAAFEEFVVKRVRDGGDLVATAVEVATEADASSDASADASARLAARLTQATRPEEGLEAFERLLCALPIEHVIVLPQELSEWIAQAAEPLSADARSQAAIDPVLLAELAETEQILVEHDAVHEAVISVHFDRPGQTRLLAHIVWDTERQATVSELRRFLRGRLPDDRLPQNFVELESLPLGEDGRVRRDELDDPYGIADDHVEPQNETERTIAKIWREALRVDRVGLHDNFFDIGGHSLLAMRVILKTEKKVGVRLNNAIMVLQTLEQIAAECDKRLGAGGGVTEAAADAPSAEGPDPGSAGAASSSLASRLIRVVRGGADAPNRKK